MRVLNSLEAMSTSMFKTPGKCRAVAHQPYLSKRDQISRACRDNDWECAPPLLLMYFVQQRVSSGYQPDSLLPGMSRLQIILLNVISV